MGRGNLTPQEEALKKIISRNIRKVIEDNGISQAEFSRRTSIPPTTISGYVKEVTRPNPGNIQKIADTFGILKSDIDPSYKEGYSIDDWKKERSNSTTLSEINRVSSKLSEHRQENVLNFAKKQLDKQQATINETAIYQLPNIKKFDDSDFINVPVLGNIAAGAPIYAEENFDGYRPVSDKYGDIGDIFWLQARGNSMVSLIYNQDYVLIEKTPFVENGEIAAVLFTDENSATLKRVYKEKNQLRLVAENEEYDDIIANGNNPAIILGRAIKVERDI